MSWIQRQLDKFKPLPATKTGKRQITHAQWLKSNWPTNVLSDDANITYENSLAVSYVYAAINGISTDIASIKWPILRKEGVSHKELREHDQWNLLNSRAYFAYSSVTWMKALVANYLATGDGFSEIIRDDSTGRPIGYRLWHKKDIEAYADFDKEELYYIITCDKNRRVDDIDMIHLSDLSYDGLLGMSRIGLAKRTLEIYNRSDTTQKEVQENATLLSGYVKIDRVLDEDDIKLIRESFGETYGGSKGGVAILDEGMSFTPFNYTMNLSDAEFIASRQFTGEEILRWFRYPAHMAGNLDRATNNNIEQISIEYVNYCLRPIVVLLENELNSKIFRSREQKNTYVKGQLKSLLRGDMDSRMKFIETMWKIGAMSANSALAFEDMNPIPFGEMTYADLNKIPVELVKEFYESKININNAKAEMGIEDKEQKDE